MASNEGRFIDRSPLICPAGKISGENKPVGQDEGDTVKTEYGVDPRFHQFQSDGQVHEMYKTTHDDYNPGEHKDRHYAKPPYNPNERFGLASHEDPWKSADGSKANSNPKS